MIAELNRPFDVAFNRQVLASIQLAFDYDRFSDVHNVFLHDVSWLWTVTGSRRLHRHGRRRLSGRGLYRFIAFPHV
jgi:hypothetical protein